MHIYSKGVHTTKKPLEDIDEKCNHRFSRIHDAMWLCNLDRAAWISQFSSFSRENRGDDEHLMACINRWVDEDEWFWRYDNRWLPKSSSATVNWMEEPGDGKKDLDVCSEEFDALKALTDSVDIPLPVPEAPAYDNLSQFISVIRSRGQPKQPQDEVRLVLNSEFCRHLSRHS